MNEPTKISYQSMGTSWNISIFDALTPLVADELRTQLFARSEAFSQLYSRFISDSFVMKLADMTGVVEVPPDFMKMLELYLALYLPSGKKLNPLIGNTISDLGYDSTYTLVEKSIVRKTPDLLETVRVVDAGHIDIKEPVLFDFGALGKGYFVDVIATMLKEKGFNNFLVDGSGDIFYFGGAPIRVGLEDPMDFSKVVGVATLSGGGLCGSAGSRRAWGGRHHIIDPETTQSPSEIVATWVAAPRAALADALATCLFFAPPDTFAPMYTFEYCVLNKTRRVIHSPGFRAELY